LFQPLKLGECRKRDGDNPSSEQ